MEKTEPEKKKEIVILEDTGYNETKEDILEQKQNSKKHVSNSLKSQSPVNHLVINGVSFYKLTKKIVK